MSDADRIPRVPKGMGPAGAALWRRIVNEYSFEDAVEALYTLEQMCREADIVARLQAVIDESPSLVTKGSYGQEVAISALSEIRQHRNLICTLQRSLNLPSDEEGDFLASGKMSRSAAGKKAAAARWSRAV